VRLRYFYLPAFDGVHSETEICSVLHVPGFRTRSGRHQKSEGSKILNLRLALGVRIEELRNALRLTRAELAERLDSITRFKPTALRR
jgi:hypothetical protein